MSHLPEFREVRVTRRVSIAKDFIAPDLSPISTHAAEMEKGKVGWTDFDKKIPTAVNGGVIVGRAEALLAEKTCAKAVVRRQPAKVTRVVTAGPTASYRAAQIAAEKLAERNRAEARARRARKA